MGAAFAGARASGFVKVFTVGRFEARGRACAHESLGLLLLELVLFLLIPFHHATPGRAEGVAARRRRRRVSDDLDDLGRPVAQLINFIESLIQTALQLVSTRLVGHRRLAHRQNEGLEHHTVAQVIRTRKLGRLVRSERLALGDDDLLAHRLDLLVQRVHVAAQLLLLLRARGHHRRREHCLARGRESRLGLLRLACQRRRQRLARRLRGCERRVEILLCLGELRSQPLLLVALVRVRLARARPRGWLRRRRCGLASSVGFFEFVHSPLELLDLHRPIVRHLLLALPELDRLGTLLLKRLHARLGMRTPRLAGPQCCSHALLDAHHNCGKMALRRRDGRGDPRLRLRRRRLDAIGERGLCSLHRGRALPLHRRALLGAQPSAFG